VYGILGEDQSDVDTLKVLVRRLTGNESLPIKGKGYGGCGEMLNKGASQLRISAIAVANDSLCATTPTALTRSPSGTGETQNHTAIGIREGCCIVVPVQALEAWILADIECATHIFTSWRPSAVGIPRISPSPRSTWKS